MTPTMNTAIICLLLTLSGCSPYKMLIYIPKFAISHIKFMGVIADTLVDAGHNVTALVSEMDATLPDGTSKASIIRISPAEGANHMNTNFMVGDTDMFEIESGSWTATIENARNNAVSFCRQCRKLLTTRGLVEKLKDEKFDVMITENFDNCGVGLSHLVSARSLIVVSSTFLFRPEDLGASLSFFGDKTAMSDGRLHDTIYSRFMHIYNLVLTRAYFSTHDHPLQELFNAIHTGMPTFSKLISQCAFAMPNIEPLMSVASPTLSRIIPIGGITVGKPKKLNDYWNWVLSLRTRTVLVSFGSIAKSALMKPAWKTALLKYEDTTDAFVTLQAPKAPNVVLTGWAPQRDLLADTRLSLFISHAGMASCHELAAFGVPALLVPIFGKWHIIIVILTKQKGDQVDNAAALAHNGVADVLSKFELTNADTMREAIGNMFNNNNYKEAARRLRDQIASRPITPAQLLLSHAEFAARFGPSKSLLPLNLDMPVLSFWGIDMIFIVIFAIVFVLIAIINLISLIRFIFPRVYIRKSYRKLD